MLCFSFKRPVPARYLRGKRCDGPPRVTWAHVNAALIGDRKTDVDEEKANFDAI